MQATNFSGISARDLHVWRGDRHVLRGVSLDAAAGDCVHLAGPNGSDKTTFPREIRRVDAELRTMVRQMLDVMYEANGIGLAANQVDLPLRVFVCNLAGQRDEGDEWVFINPVISRAKGQAEKEEGCLSLPGLYAPVKRPEVVRLQAYSLAGEELDLELAGLMARVVQHEVDHLDGVLFIDRLGPTVEMNVRTVLEEFQLDFDSRRKVGDIPSDDQIAARLRTLEQQYGAPA